MVVVLLTGGVCFGVQQLLLPQNELALATGHSIMSRVHVLGLRFVILAVVVVVIPNVVFFALYHHTEEYKYIKGVLSRIFGKFTKKFKRKIVTRK